MKSYLPQTLQKTGKDNAQNLTFLNKGVLLISVILVSSAFVSAQVEFRDNSGFMFYDNVDIRQGGLDIQEGGLAVENGDLDFENGSVNMNNNRIFGLPQASSSGEPLTLGGGSGDYVDRQGDSMTGDLDLRNNTLLGANATLDFDSGELTLNQEMPDSGSPTTIQLNQDGNPNWALVSMQDGGLGVYDAQAGEVVTKFNENGQIEFLNRDVAVNNTLSVDDNEIQDVLNIKSTSNNDLRIGAGAGGSDRVRIRDNANGEDIAEFEEGTQNVYIPNGKLDLNRNYLDFNPTQGLRITPGDTSVSNSDDNSDLEYQTDGEHLFYGGDVISKTGDIVSENSLAVGKNSASQALDVAGNVSFSSPRIDLRQKEWDGNTTSRERRGSPIALGGRGTTYEDVFEDGNWPNDGVEKGMDRTDSAFFMPVTDGTEDSDLRLVVTDNPEDRFSIWTCAQQESCSNIEEPAENARFMGNGDNYFALADGAKEAEVGIGTTDPTSKLDVDGSAEIEGSADVSGEVEADGGFRSGGGSYVSDFSAGTDGWSANEGSLETRVWLNDPSRTRSFWLTSVCSGIDGPTEFTRDFDTPISSQDNGHIRYALRLLAIGSWDTEDVFLDFKVSGSWEEVEKLWTTGTPSSSGAGHMRCYDRYSGYDVTTVTGNYTVSDPIEAVRIRHNADSASGDESLGVGFIEVAKGCADAYPCGSGFE